jgi:DNA polymerase I
MKRPVLLLIDGHAILHRAFHALPPMTAPDGHLVNAAYGFVQILLKILSDLDPSHVAVAFDTAAATFRHEAYEDYKATRKEQPNELYAQLEDIESLLEALRVPIYALDGFEADDVIGTIVAACARKRSSRPLVRILTGDLDILQLVSDDVSVLALTTSMSAPKIYDAEAVHARFGLAPEQIRDFKALAGDPSDNIPGVAGVGKKTATTILQTYGTIDVALEAATNGTAGEITPRIAARLVASAETIARDRDLVTIRQNAPVHFSLEDTERKDVNRPRLLEVVQQLGFHSLLKRFPENVPSDPSPPEHPHNETNTAIDTVNEISSPAEIQRLAEQLNTTDGFEVIVSQDEGSPRTAHPRALIVHHHEQTTSMAPWGAALAGFASLLSNPSIPKRTNDSHALLHACAQSHVTCHGITDDTMLASYLLSPGSRKHTINDVAIAELGMELGDDITERANAVAQIVPRFRARLDEENLTNVYETLELPLTPVLVRMERAGIAVDTATLAKLSKTMHRTLEKADRAIFQLAGHEFSIDSPAQLKVVLFEELDLRAAGIRKTAKGKTLSTAASELEKLRGSHPIIDHILVHRELKKLVSTYVDALPALVDPMTGRIHTTYHQTVAATGRLSSADPNLQNIPVSEPWGPAIRSAFIAEKGWTLLACDYSQFELRVAAALSGDEALSAAFRSGEDIHSSTGAKVFGVDPNDVTKDQRRIAKAINFGILYGMGAQALARTADLAHAEAVEYIQSYFAAYPTLHTWIEETKDAARVNGYASTRFGRKRYLPEMTSQLRQVRSAAERMAVNLPIQGTQADLVKRAMIDVDNWIRAKNNDAVRLLLQVHDELVFEVRDNALDDARDAIVSLLERVGEAADFTIPIVVSAKQGPNWGSLVSV